MLAAYNFPEHVSIWVAVADKTCVHTYIHIFTCIRTNLQMYVHARTNKHARTRTLSHSELPWIPCSRVMKLEVLQ